MMLPLQLVCIVISIFFTITIYMYVIQNSMSIYFCPIYYDQKRSTEFNWFKMKIFTNIWSVTFCLYLVDRTCKYWIQGSSIYAMGCTTDKPCNCKRKIKLIMLLPTCSVKARAKWSLCVQKPGAACFYVLHVTRNGNQVFRWIFQGKKIFWAAY